MTFRVPAPLAWLYRGHGERPACPRISRDEFRRKGLGRELLERLIRIARDERAQTRRQHPAGKHRDAGAAEKVGLACNWNEEDEMVRAELTL